ncbi:hypothetical protein [Desulfobotulus mexicanus]|uniref:Molecular chaperone DnaK n=1 Tax=Desulfobotulus mexicanus TaxID=2586642 RepID=A0A5S5MFM2_9BACT|nr:hypothetical protein [Desulfobotulus mexicanus]TYT74479.1 hypothetical protein FIM25_10015 [Desulfobotulus mexicanus]
MNDSEIKNPHPQTAETEMEETVEKLLKNFVQKDLNLENPEKLSPFLQDILKNHFRTALNESQKKLSSKAFWWIGKDGRREILLDTKTLFLWEGNIRSEKTFTVPEAKADANQKQILGLNPWHLPEREEFWGFVSNEKNPMRTGTNNELTGGYCYFLTIQGRVDLAHVNPEPVADQKSKYLAVNRDFKKKSLSSLLFYALENGWQVWPTELGIEASNGDIFKDLYTFSLNTGSLKRLDSQSCPLPELKDEDICDVHKGLWELWGTDPEILKKLGIRAKNPADEVKKGYISIDFGTSSTVVAYEDNTQHKLLRIGVSDHYEAPKPEHYENPTILEIIDFKAFITPWRQQAYRPDVKWKDVRCSHEALATLRDNESDPRVTASILNKLKQWALREDENTRIFLTDRNNGHEHRLESLTLRNPVKGKALEVGPGDPFDPLELYAWFLGLYINWRKWGIHLKYFMTFPVSYPAPVKEKIQSSFRRGLQRSLPQSLISHDCFNSFSVDELYSEPAAFAASAFPYWKLEATKEGLAYGVFDFGGGTTDFDFGIYREPTEKEEDQEIEEVFEHFGAAGDNFLGGENLLENMAYMVFRNNLDLCRKYKFAFTKPLDAHDFPGSEMLLEKTQAAHTNTQMMMARLRPFWETETRNSTGVEKIKMVNREGAETECDLAIPYEEMEGYLKQRLAQGMKEFFTAMHKAFTDQGKTPKRIHLFLAGNASQSSRLKALLDGNENSPWMLGEKKASGKDDPKKDRENAEILEQEVQEFLNKVPTSFDNELILSKIYDFFISISEVKVADNLALLKTDEDIFEFNIMGLLNTSADIPDFKKDIIKLMKDEAIAPRIRNELYPLVGMNAPQTESVASEATEEKAPVSEIMDYLTTLYDGNAPEILIYPPIPKNISNPDQATAKTGVALGLLRLSPGNNIKVINCSTEESKGNPPFGFYVGRIRKKIFFPSIQNHARYGEWEEMGTVMDRVFRMVYTRSPSAATGAMPSSDAALIQERLEFAGECNGHKVFARPVDPHKLEICTARNMEELEAGKAENLQELPLKKG